jgi:AcrR family transcriptional regulator
VLENVSILFDNTGHQSSAICCRSAHVAPVVDACRRRVPGARRPTRRCREIFVCDGYEAFTIRTVAKQIGFSPGNIYLYFRDKNEIFDCLVDQSFADLLAALPQPDETEQEDPVKLLRRSLRVYVKFGLDHPNHYRFSALLAACPATASTQAARRLRELAPQSATLHRRETI